MLDIENVVMELKNVLDGFISTLVRAKERTSEVEDITTETSKIEKQREKN